MLGAALGAWDLGVHRVLVNDDGRGDQTALVERIGQVVVGRVNLVVRSDREAADLKGLTGSRRHADNLAIFKAESLVNGVGILILVRCERLDGLVRHAKLLDAGLARRQDDVADNIVAQLEALARQALDNDAVDRGNPIFGPAVQRGVGAKHHAATRALVVLCQVVLRRKLELHGAADHQLERPQHAALGIGPQGLDLVGKKLVAQIDQLGVVVWRRHLGHVRGKLLKVVRVRVRSEHTVCQHLVVRRVDVRHAVRAVRLLHGDNIAVLVIVYNVDTQWQDRTVMLRGETRDFKRDDGALGQLSARQVGCCRSGLLPAAAARNDAAILVVMLPHDRRLLDGHSHVGSLKGTRWARHRTRAR